MSAPCLHLPHGLQRGSPPGARRRTCCASKPRPPGARPGEGEALFYLVSFLQLAFPQSDWHLGCHTLWRQTVKTCALSTSAHVSDTSTEEHRPQGRSSHYIAAKWQRVTGLVLPLFMYLFLSLYCIYWLTLVNKYKFQVGSSFRFLSCIDFFLQRFSHGIHTNPPHPALYPRIHSFRKYLLCTDKIHLCPFPFACGFLPRADTAAQRMLTESLIRKEVSALCDFQILCDIQVTFACFPWWPGPVLPNNENFVFQHMIALRKCFTREH